MDVQLEQCAQAGLVPKKLVRSIAPMPRVLIIQGQMKQYRIPFFSKLGDALSHDGIGLKVAYSDPRNPDGRDDNCDLPQGLGLKVKGRWVFGSSMLWQPLLREVRSADLIVAEQANKHLLTHVLAFLSMAGVRRVAFWGLGENKCADRSEFSEWLRRRIVKRVSWWFAYSQATRAYLLSNGVPPDRITVVRNAVDTMAFSRLLDSIPVGEVTILQREFGINTNSTIGLFCGGLTPDKGIGFLLESVKIVRAQLPDFHLIVLGGGPEEEKVKAAARVSPWVHYMGAKFGAEKGIFFKMAKVFLLPGRVGLAILDAFAAGLPLLTTNVPYHGPEIEYLENGHNGLITEYDVNAYGNAIVSLVRNSLAFGRLKKGAQEARQRYSMEAMVENFYCGIRRCLQISESRV